jgi:hypothetical protein
MNAVRLGSYELTENDERFLGFAEGWFRDEPV